MRDERARRGLRLARRARQRPDCHRWAAPATHEAAAVLWPRLVGMVTAVAAFRGHVRALHDVRRASPLRRGCGVGVVLAVSGCAVWVVLLGGEAAVPTANEHVVGVSGAPGPTDPGTVDLPPSPGLAGSPAAPAAPAPGDPLAEPAAGVGAAPPRWLTDAAVAVVCALLALAGVVFSTVYPVRRRQEADAERRALLGRIDEMQRRLEVLQRRLEGVPGVDDVPGRTDGAVGVPGGRRPPRPTHGGRSRPRAVPERRLVVFDHASLDPEPSEDAAQRPAVADVDPGHDNLDGDDAHIDV